jgi:hypothetical protein
MVSDERREYCDVKILLSRICFDGDDGGGGGDDDRAYNDTPSCTCSPSVRPPCLTSGTGTGTGTGTLNNGNCDVVVHNDHNSHSNSNNARLLLYITVTGHSIIVIVESGGGRIGPVVE